MNAEPHTHRPELTRDPMIVFGRRYVLTYGDTTVKVSWTRPSSWSDAKRKRVLERKLRLAIRRHDEGTRRAAINARNREHNRQVLDSIMDGLQGGQWADVQLANKVAPRS